jgi:bacterioferritin-associated ferredoxin
MNAETKAALERAASLCEYHGIEWGVAAGQNTVTDAAIIRRLIEREASERADVVAWLRAGEICGVNNNAARKIAAAIEAGAHVGASKGGGDE